MSPIVTLENSLNVVLACIQKKMAWHVTSEFGDKSIG